MSEPTNDELRQLRAELDRLNQRLQRLEVRATVPAASVPRAPEDRPPAPTVAAAPAPVAPSAAPRTSESLETRIGRDWLNRIGIASLVLGVVFFIMYTFQYFGPGMKIATGLAIAVGLLLSGVWLETRPSLRWYGRGLIGGGWALLYFTCYAMYHVPSVRLLHSPLADLVLLIGVAAGAVVHSLSYRSETVTALALLLGFATTAVSEVTGFTLLSSVLLVGTLAALILRMRWARLLWYGAALSYALFFFRLGPQIDASGPVLGWAHLHSDAARCWLKAGFLLLYWIAYHVPLFRMDGRHGHGRTLPSATLINAFGATGGLLAAMEWTFPSHQWLVLVGLGSAYLLSVPVARRRGLETVATVCTLLGLGLLTWAIPMRLTGHWVTVLWTLELPLCVIGGFLTRRPAVRAFAAGLAVVLVGRLLTGDLWLTTRVDSLDWSIPMRVILGLLGSASLWLTGEVYRHPAFRDQAGEEERTLARVYRVAAAGIGWLLTCLEVRARWLPTALAAESLAGLLLGWQRPDRLLRALGAIVWTTVAGALLWTLFNGEWHWLPIGAVVAGLYAAAWRYRADPPDAMEWERGLRGLFIVAGSLLMTALLAVEVRRDWLSVAWAAQGLGLLAAGFHWRDRLLRLCGLAVFAALIGKILLIDLAGAATVYRILSFLAAGVVLLIASFVYGTRSR